MTFLDTSSLCSSNQTKDRVFIFEVIGLRSTIGPANPANPIRQSGRMEIKVPYARMSQEMRRIAMQGGKIVSIRPLGTEAQVGDSSQKELAWWLKVHTQQPNNDFYFGPFETSIEAESQLPGYMEDLRDEGAEDITFELRQGKPDYLSIANAA